jgi:hypothetical protein
MVQSGYVSILEDPEVTVHLERTGMRDRFEGGRCPLSPSINYLWPFEATASNFEFRLIRNGLFLFGGPELRPTPQVSALSAALADRIAAFRSLLVSGKIQAFGLSNHLGESFVPERQWARKNILIDVSNGDLGQESSKGDFLPLWTGIELRSRITEAIQREDSAHKAAAPVRKRRPKGQEVEDIIKRKGIDVREVGPKAAASEVMKYMKEPPQSENEVKALEVLVRRISQVLNRTH